MLGPQYRCPGGEPSGGVLGSAVLLLLVVATSMPTAQAGGGGGGGGGGSSGPVIVDFAAIENPDNVWTFEGQVTDPTNPGLCTVYLGGLPSLVGKSVECDASGYFTIDIPLTSQDLGTATAQAVDGQGLKSNVAVAYVD